VVTALLPLVPEVEIAAAPAPDMSIPFDAKTRNPAVFSFPVPEIVSVRYTMSRVSVVVPDEITTSPSAPVPKLNPSA
jgi:hypothetical protein